MKALLFTADNKDLGSTELTEARIGDRINGNLVTDIEIIDNLTIKLTVNEPI